jgi:hypothetical protein
LSTRPSSADRHANGDQHTAAGISVALIAPSRPAEHGAFDALVQGPPPAITEHEAHAIGVDAYVYFYPLVSMHVTRKQAGERPARLRNCE